MPGQPACSAVIGSEPTQVSATLIEGLPRPVHRVHRADPKLWWTLRLQKPLLPLLAQLAAAGTEAEPPTFCQRQMRGHRGWQGSPQLADEGWLAGPGQDQVCLGASGSVKTLPPRNPLLCLEPPWALGPGQLCNARTLSPGPS